MTGVVTSEEQFYTPAALAQKLAVSERQVHRWIRSGELRSYKIGNVRRIDPADVDSFLASHREEAA